MAKNILFSFLSGSEEATTQVTWKHERDYGPFSICDPLHEQTTEEEGLMTVAVPVQPEVQKWVS